MADPGYDINALRRGVIAISGDIETYEKAITELKRRRAEYEKHIAVAEAKKNGGPN